MYLDSNISMRTAFLTLVGILTIFNVYPQTNSIDHLIAEGELNKALEQVVNLPDNNDKYNYLGVIYLQKGQYEEAKNSFNKALTHDGGSSKLDRAECYANIATVERAMGNSSKSLEYHFRALEIRKEENNQAAIAASYNDIGLSYFSINIDLSLEYYEMAFDIYKKLYKPEDDRIAIAHTNIGLAYNEMGLYGDAIINFEEALKIRKKNHGFEHPTVAIILSSLGTVYYNMNNLDPALRYQQDALNIYQKAYGAKHPEIASTYNLIGRVLRSMEDFEGAVSSYHSAVLSNIPDYDNTDIYSYPEIENYYNGDLLLVSLLDKVRAFQDLHFGKTLKPRDLKAAYQNLELCDNLIDKLRREKSDEQDKLNLGKLASEVYEEGIRLSLTIAELSWKKKLYYNKAYYYSEKSKAAVLLDAIAETNAKSFANIPQEKIALEQALKTEIAYYRQKIASKPPKDKEESYRHELFTLTNEYQKFIDDLETNYSDYYRLKYNVGLPTVEEVINKLNETTVLLSYFITEQGNDIYIFEISTKGLRVHKNTTQEDINRLIAGYRNSIYYNFKETYLNTANELYKLLIPHLSSKIENIIIVPAGKLGIIPFEALLQNKPDEKEEFNSLPYLVKKYAISTQFSTALLSMTDRTMSEENNICLIAPVDFDKHKLPMLPGTATEVDAISKIFMDKKQKAKTFINDDASEVVVKSDAISSSKYLHFATHGIVNEEKPELSQVFLASQESEDGNLYSGEIYNLSINADLVTLSACQTGLGKIHRGEGIVGLSRALIYSGANNLVVSLWSVADQSTSDLMINFYSGIVGDNKSYANALQTAKLNMISNSTYSSPYYWAPFTLIGK